jgi:type I restriction enzyme, S subunit
MRDRWEKIRLGDVASLLTSGSRGWGDYYADEGCLFIRMTNLPREGIHLKLDDLKFVNIPHGNNEGKRTRLMLGDILISITAELGKIGFIDDSFTQEAYVNQHVALLRVSHPNICNEFLAYLLSYPTERNKLEHLNDAGAKAGLNLGTINDFTIKLPPLPEQRKIAAILRTWDDAIDKTRNLISKKVEYLSWVRQNICTGEVRLKGFDTLWQKITLSEILCEHKKTGNGTEQVCSVSVHKGVINQIEHLGRSFAAKDTGKYNLVHHGDIIYTKSPTGDFPLGIIKQSRLDDNVIVSPLYGVYTPCTGSLGIILDFYFESFIFTANYLKPLVQKGAKNTLSVTNARFLEGTLILPVVPEEQTQIANLIEVLRAEIRVLNKRQEALQSQKRGLMQKLLTGAWRVQGDESYNTQAEKISCSMK